MMKCAVLLKRNLCGNVTKELFGQNKTWAQALICFGTLSC